MSSRRIRSDSRLTQAEINDLVLKLQALLPHSSSRCTSTVAATSKLLEETCNYIRSLHREVDDLSERLSRTLASMNSDVIDLDTFRSIL